MIQLEQIAAIFEECFRDAAVFERSVGGAVVETDVLRKEGKKWAVVAAGVDFDEAYTFFPDHPKRAERAGEPVRILPSGQLSMLIVARPITTDELTQDAENVATFAPARGIPFVRIRDGSFLRCWDITDPDRRVRSLRWELDSQYARSDPSEEWLGEWKRYVGFNPAHSASHLHINAPAFVPNAPIDDRIEHSLGELRLGVGTPNPLGLVLSLAAWLRSLPIER